MDKAAWEPGPPVVEVTISSLDQTHNATGKFWIFLKALVICPHDSGAHNDTSSQR